MKRSKFSLSHYRLLTAPMGQLVPIGLMEVLPGDSIQHASSALVRVSPLLAPVMHPVHVRIHHWFVPNRILWEDWEDFITGGEDGMDASVFPTVTLSDAELEPGLLADLLGVPPNEGSSDTLAVSALPFRAYQLIFNEWYRDQDLVTKSVISKASGADTTTDRVLKSVAWEKDYFTSARPWAQKGPDVLLPLGTLAPVERANNANAWTLKQAGTNSAPTAAGVSHNAGVLSSDNTLETFSLDPGTGLVADLSAATAVEVNLVREAFALQRYEEARARYGSRYTEYLRYLGVKSSDARLQRPEYLGGGRQTIQFSEVVQTGVTTDGDDTEGVGNLKGHGIGAMRSNRYRRFFEEHGFIVSTMSVLPKTIYAQGLPRHWNRRTKEDFFQRELQHIGQQEVLNKELYAFGGSPDAVFGYQDRYDEYRRAESGIAGEFRGNLDYWHMARLFTGAPTLNGSFVTADPTDRIYAAGSTQDALQVMVNHSIQARRIVAASGKSFIF